MKRKHKPILLLTKRPRDPFALAAKQRHAGPMKDRRKKREKNRDMIRTEEK